MAESDSVPYYDQHADRFLADTSAVDMSALYDRLLAVLPVGGRILDAGCGGGRDTAAFLSRGYSVVAFDASVEMVRRATKMCGPAADVRHMRFRDARWNAEFDGIWACASLLHVSRSELPGVVRRLAAGLRSGGAFYMSFKYGTSERVVGDRTFTDCDERLMQRLLGESDLEPLDVWSSPDLRPGRASERWLNALARHGVPAPERV
jgi:SAM-dependent methyltransferase